jgi:CRP-like cAMP-binding protein
MAQDQETSNDFLIWGIDNAPYGPVELPTLVTWVKDERVLVDTWIFSRLHGSWSRASELPELKMFFNRRQSGAMDDSSAGALTPKTLRRIKILAELNDAQLDQLAQYMELMQVPQWAVVVKKGDQGDSMYFIVDGELRARVLTGGAESSLATFGPGEFFGDISLFDHGPRSADVIANYDSTLLKMTAISFERLSREAPALATPFLSATVRTLVARIRADNKRLGTVAEQFAASETTLK